MANPTSVLTDHSLLSRIDQRLYRYEKNLALISGLTVFALISLAVVSVSGRNLLNRPVLGYVDWVEQAMPLIAFMGIAFTQRVGGHIRMDILIAQLKGRALWCVEAIGVAITLAVMLLLVWGTYEHFLRSIDFSQPLWSRDSSMDIALPLWPAKLLAPIAFGVLSLRLSLQLIGYSLATIDNTPRPVAVPLIESVAEQAAKESNVL